MPSTKVVGHRWSARSSEVREFLARNQVPYRWYSSDEPEGRRLLSAAGQDGQRLPVVITPDGTPLVEPEAPGAGRPGGPGDHADGRLLRPGGDRRRPGRARRGGVRGLGGAADGAGGAVGYRWAGRAEFRIENYLGFPDGVSGGQLTDRARRQAAKFGAEILTAREVTGLEVSGAARVVRFSDGSAIAAHSVILATGVSYRQLTAPGTEDLAGCGVFYGSALTEAASCQGHDVYIVGGANSAGQAAMYLARGAKSVTLLVRGGSLEASMSYYLIQQIEETPNIRVRCGTLVEGAHGDGHLERLTLRDAASGATELVDAQWLFVFIGAAPLTDWLDGTVLRDERGFILAGPDLTPDGRPPADWELDRPPYHLETSVPGVFVAGDARAESAKRVASAVGEGAMAVMLVHRYLEQS
ncbi:FAD-dependent oxidoreductase OS=Streptomyces tendae OX=1932 GN=GUR47_36045 PE=4 SV=1 [Streptomyces tendae]